MMPIPTWIDLRFGARGELRPILIEHRGAYEIFDDQAFRPKVVLSIGSAEKRHFYRSLALDGQTAGSGIHFRPIQLATLLIDCELHNQRRLDLCQPTTRAGHQNHHELHCALTPHSPPQKITQFAFDLYWQLLFPFASTVILFADDLGGFEPVMELLVSWAKRARLKPISSPPRILVIFHWRHRLDMETFEAQLRARLTSNNSISGSRKGIGSPIHLDGECAFESVRLIPNWKLSSEFLIQVEESFSVRENAGFGFSGEHLRRLLETAVDQFGQCCGQQIDFCHAARLQNPVPEQLVEGISFLMTAVKDPGFDHETIIASALDLDAHPPGMHFFPPSLTFRNWYSSILSRVESDLGQAGLTARIRERFINLALDRREGSSARTHSRLLGQFQRAWKQLLSNHICLLCLARPAFNHLRCKHRLCDGCAIITSSPISSGSPEVLINHCPLCRAHHGVPILIRPPTAGLRMLEIGGTSQSKWEMLKFLKELKSMTGLPLSLPEHFDLVVSSGIGLFFAQTAFLESWALPDCQYHLKNLCDPKFDAKRSLVCFGKGLTWEMAKMTGANGLIAVAVFDSHRSMNASERHAAELRGFMRRQQNDVAVRYMGGHYNSLPLKIAAARMLSSLFYIELVFAPRFCSSPERVQAQLLCRLAPGAALMSLIKSLSLRGAQLKFWGTGSVPNIERLITRSSLNRCRQGGAFRRPLDMEVWSMHTELHVEIEDGIIGQQSISHCPYVLGELIRDQGLDCVFGRRDHRAVEMTRDVGISITEEIEELGEELGRFASFQG